MKDPLVNNKNGHQFRENGGGGFNSGNGAAKGTPVVNRGGPKGRKSRYCWNFNKGVPCKFGSKCKFIECCSFCDSPAHGLIGCPKADKKDMAANNAAAAADSK